MMLIDIAVNSMRPVAGRQRRPDHYIRLPVAAAADNLFLERCAQLY